DLAITLSGPGSFTSSADGCSGKKTKVEKAKTCSVTVTYAPSAAGPESATLTASSGKPIASSSLTLTGCGSTGTQTSPRAVLNADRTDGPLPLTVNFSSAGSSDPDPCDSISFDWDFGDGSAHSTDPNPSHTYTVRGRYTVILKVTDSAGNTHS